MQTLGRPTVLDDARCAQICDLVAEGHTVATVARLVGCDVKTIRRHAERDENFGRLLRAAEFKSRSDPLKVMQRAANSNWRAAAWLLERTDPQRFGKQAPLTCRPEEVAAAFSRVIESALSQLDDLEAQRLLYKVLSKAAEQETLRLFLPPGAREQPSERDMLRKVEDQRTTDLLESIMSVASSPLRTPSTKSPARKPSIKSEKNPHSAK